MLEGLVCQSIELPRGELRLLQPQEAAARPDAGPVEWAPVAPYWSVLWRSGVALARELDRVALRGLRVVELGCGLALPSLAAALGGARVLATDWSPDAVALAAANAARNGITLETLVCGWSRPDAIVARAPWDLVLAADVLYERRNVDLLLALLPRLVGERGEVLLADPGRPAAPAFLERAAIAWDVRTSAAPASPTVSLHRLRRRARGAA